MEVDHDSRTGPATKPGSTIEAAEAPARLSVLHVSQPVVGGVARYVADLVADQVRRGWQVGVACPEGTLAADVRALGADQLRWDAGREPGPRSLLETRSLAAIVRARRPELVHLHSSKAGLAGRLALHGSHATLFQPHGWSFGATGGLTRLGALAWERLAVRWCDVVVCVSEGERAGGEQRGLRARWRVVPNAVDLDTISEATPADRAAARQALGLDDQPTVVCVGRLSWQKGQDVLVRAWPEVADHVSGAQLVLVGDGPERSALSDLASNRIRIVGWSSDVGSWLAAADVVAVPSRLEGMSIGMLEAMARGRSVVATDVAGACDALGGEAGAIVPVEDGSSLARALVERLLDPELALTEGQAGRRRVAEAHDLKLAIDAIARVYGEVLDSRAAAQVAP